jgi:hypothetical protein
MKNLRKQQFSKLRRKAPPLKTQNWFSPGSATGKLYI